MIIFTKILVLVKKFTKLINESYCSLKKIKEIYKDIKLKGFQELGRSRGLFSGDEAQRIVISKGLASGNPDSNFSR